jgi:hypothetical protein
VEHNYDTIPEIGSDDFYPRLHFAASAMRENLYMGLERWVI